jgi:DNA modification methylase
MSVRILIGDCRDKLRELPDASVNCCVTSPPYFGLRDYGCDGQMGLEPTPDEFVAGMVEVFREVRRVLRDDGTLWLNIGDSYQNAKGQSGGIDPKQPARRHLRCARPQDKTIEGFKPKDLIGVPWMLAFALRADGWYLRQDIIWSKPNPMPESVRDRCTKAHEYLFLLSKSPKYYFDADAIAEPSALATIARLSQNVDAQEGSNRVPGKTNGPMKAVGRKSWKGSRFTHGKTAEHQLSRAQSEDGRALGEKGAQTPDEVRASAGARMGRGAGWRDDPANIPEKRNRRSVWEVATQPFSEAHFATYPPALIEPCILACCPEGGTVLDPFGGAGTTGLVADRLQRDAILIELNPEYAEIARERIAKEAGMFGEVLAA